MRDGTEATRQAVILDFPARGEPAAQDRLRRALAALDDATAQQRRAVAEWRLALAALQHAVGGLQGAVRAQHRAFGDLARGVDALHGELLRLRAWGEAAARPRG